MKVLLLLLFLSPIVLFSQNYPYKNLVFEGGGIRGLAYGGALRVLEEKGVIKNVQKVAGTSAGAITAMLVGLGYSSHEIDSILYKLRIQKFNDGFLLFNLLGIKKNYGVFKGERFEQWLGQLIKTKLGSSNTTFAELHRMHLLNDAIKDVYCLGTSVTQQKAVIFSWLNTPQMQVKTAVHISGCIPLYFKPVALDSSFKKIAVKKAGPRDNLYVDGGLLINFPINIFDSCLNGSDPFTCDSVWYNRETLGLKLERENQVQAFKKGHTEVVPYQAASFIDYLMALNNLLQETLGRKTPRLQNEQGRTIYISYGDLFGKPRKVSDAEKKFLFSNGYEAAKTFFASHPSPAVN